MEPVLTVSDGSLDGLGGGIRALYYKRDVDNPLLDLPDHLVALSYNDVITSKDLWQTLEKRRMEQGVPDELVPKLICIELYASQIVFIRFSLNEKGGKAICHIVLERDLGKDSEEGFEVDLNEVKNCR